MPIWGEVKFMDEYFAVSDFRNDKLYPRQD